MDLTATENQRLAFLTIFTGLLVIFVGLVAGLGLTFSLLEAVALWPLPAWEVSLPGSVRGWQAAHVGGILNGVMIAGAGLLMLKKVFLSWMGNDYNWLGQYRFLLGRKFIIE